MTISLKTLIAQAEGIDPDEIGCIPWAQEGTEWKRMRRLTIACLLETEYGITLSLDDLEQLRSIAGARDILARHGISDTVNG